MLKQVAEENPKEVVPTTASKDCSPPAKEEVAAEQELGGSLDEVVDGGNRPLINAVGSASWYPSPKTAVPSSSSPHIFQH